MLYDIKNVFTFKSDNENILMHHEQSCRQWLAHQ